MRDHWSDDEAQVMQAIESQAQSRAPLRELIAFTTITYALVLAVAVALPDALISLLFNSLAPMIAVVILTFTMFRRGTRRELWRSFGLRRAGVHTWGSALGVPLVLCGGAFGIALLIGAGHLRPFHITGATAGYITANFLLGLLLFTCEEIGFRGFMLPRIQQLTTKRRAALMTGFLHALFHLPILLIATTYDTVGPRWIAAPVAIVTITAAGVFYAWLWDRSGSIWATGIGHTLANLTFAGGFAVVASTTSESLAFVAGETGFATVGVVVIMAVVLLMRAKVWQTPAVPTLTTEKTGQPVTAS